MLNIFNNLENYSKKINFDKKGIYEYLYLHYNYFPNFYNRQNLIDDKFFASKNNRINNSTKVLNQCIYYSQRKDNNIKEYINNFINENLLKLNNLNNI